MSDDALPNIDLNDYEEVQEEPAAVEEPVEDTEGTEQEDNEGAEEDDEILELQIKEAPAPPQEELFEIPKPKGKKKRVMSEKQKAALAKAREKSNEKRKAMAIARRKEEALIKAEKKAHLRKRRQKKLEQDALLEDMAETSVMKKEQSMWDEDKLVNLMNRTMDTYFTKRQEEKTRRQQIPVDPAIYANYQPAQPPQRSIQRPRQPAAPKKLRNPYSQLFGLSAEDEEMFNL